LDLVSSGGRGLRLLYAAFKVRSARAPAKETDKENVFKYHEERIVDRERKVLRQLKWEASIP
jgi:hypothetical protein